MMCEGLCKSHWHMLFWRVPVNPIPFSLALWTQPGSPIWLPYGFFSSNTHDLFISQRLSANLRSWPIYLAQKPSHSTSDLHITSLKLWTPSACPHRPPITSLLPPSSPLISPHLPLHALHLLIGMFHIIIGGQAFGFSCWWSLHDQDQSNCWHIMQYSLAYFELWGLTNRPLCLHLKWTLPHSPKTYWLVY